MVLVDWKSIQIGDRINIVCESVLLRCDGKSIMKQSGSGEFFVLYGELPELGSAWTIINAMVVDGQHRLALSVETGTFVHLHTPMEFDNIGRCVELGCGGGFMSVGFKAAGFEISMGVDKNSRFASTYHENDLGSFIPGCMGDSEVIKKILQQGGQNATLLSGIACQPYSTAGDQRSDKDERSSSLPFTLACAWYLQSPLVVFECTPKAMTDQYVQSQLKQFCRQFGFHMTQSILHLDRCWSANRTRWWCILSVAPLGAIHFADLPLKPEFRTIKQIMPYIKQWPEPDLADLALSLYEHSKFQAYGRGVVSNLMNVDAAMPTALHSWGNQCYPCQCKCRAGFSEWRLQQKGLHGLLIPGDETIHHENQTFPKCRHVHPSEVALLSGAFPNIDWKHQCRLGLATTGQMASPLQACWVGAHVLRALQAFAHCQLSGTPEEILGELQSQILMVRDLMWPPIESPELVPTRSLPLVSGSLKVLVSRIPYGNTVVVTFSEGATIAQLIEAETALTQQYVSLFAFNSVGHQLPNDATLLDGFTYFIGTQCEHQTQLDAVRRSEAERAQACAVPLDLPMDFEGVQHEQQVVHENSGSQVGIDEPVTTDHLGDEPMPEVKFGFPIGVAASEDCPMDRVSSDALCQVSRAGLLALLCPCANSSTSLASLQSMQIPRAARLQILQNQMTLWADDEIRFQLQSLLTHDLKGQNFVVWDPLIISSAFQHHQVPTLPSELITPEHEVTAISVLLVDSHWIPIVWRRDSFHLLGFVANASDEQLLVIQDFHGQVCRLLGVPISKLTNRVVFGIQPDCCGVVAIEFLSHMLHGSGPFRISRDMILDAHCEYRRKFIESLHELVVRPWVWGNGFVEDQGKLAGLLRQHGVPDDAIMPRIDMLYNKLGKEAVLQSMHGSQPWRDLKWIANQQVPVVQIVRPVELEKSIAAKTGSVVSVGRKHQGGKSKGKGSKGVSSSLQIVDPASLRIEEGTFVLGDGSRLSQLQITDIGPLATGVVLAKHQDALPFISTGKAVSNGGLAIIVVDPPADATSIPSISEKISFPVICAANCEPMLIEAAMYQLGHHPVSKAVATSLVKLQSIDTCTAKIAVFRDQVKVEWSEIVSHPLRYIMHTIPLLTLCGKATCDQKCGAWHIPEGTELKDPLLEVWNRQWMTMAFSQSPPKDAEVFAVTVRLPKLIESTLQQFSGVDGVFLEPKAIDGRLVSSEYHVVWVAKASFSQISLYRQTIPGVVGIARIAGKYGLRCLAEDSLHVHSAVKPDSPYLPAGAKLLYMVGPVPWGTLKKSLSDAFKEMKWPARPLQASPAGREFCGVNWKVQATCPPPQKVLHLATGEVVITRVDIPVSQPALNVKPAFGSIATVNLATKPEQTVKGQPVQLLRDPWDGYKPIARSPDVVASDALAALEKKVTSNVMAQLPKDNMELDGDINTARVDKLEAQVHALHEQQVKLQGLIHDNATTQQAQIVQLQTQFQAQHSQLEAVVTDQSTQIRGLSSSFSQQLEKQQQHLDFMFQAQMQKMEDLLSKKPRRE